MKGQILLLSYRCFMIVYNILRIIFKGICYIKLFKERRVVRIEKGSLKMTKNTGTHSPKQKL